VNAIGKWLVKNGAWVAVFLLGTGAWWQYRTQSLEEKKFAASQAEVRLELREKTTNTLLQVLEIISSAAQCGPLDGASAKARATVNALKADLKEYEAQLAALESRKPREDLFGSVGTQPCPGAIEIH
jgi:hypothetical protein